MASFPKIALVYDRYKKASAKHPAPIEVRVTYERRQKYIRTGVEVRPKEWKKESICNRSDAAILNKKLEGIVAEVNQVLLDMQEEHNINIFSIPERIERKRKGIVTFYDFIRERADVREYDKAEGTKKRYERFVSSFREYGKIRDFKDITESSLISYDSYLTSTGLKTYSRWANYHRFLNSFIIDAIGAGYMTVNPYRRIKIERGKEYGIDKYLTPEEFKKIQRVELPTESLQKVRDVFVFQTYTCLSYTDLKDFSAEKIVETKGMKVYTGHREKTGKGFTIPLLHAAMEILKKYNYKLPVISNVKYNQYLKVVAQAAGIDKPVSTHWARHTGATMLLNAGIPMQVVSKICGHSSTRITEQVYAKLLDETVVETIQTNMPQIHKVTSISLYIYSRPLGHRDYFLSHLRAVLYASSERV